MQKKIGVFIGDIQNEYPKVIIQAIFEEADRLGYDVLVFGMYGSYGDNLLYAEGEKNMLYLPDLSRLDGIIACEDTFDIDTLEGELERLLLERAKCPVVYLRREKKAFYNVLISSKEPMYQMTKHFIEKHGLRDICFMQGPMTYSDAIERYEGFCEAMSEAGIPITEHMVFEGDYWREKGKEAVDWFMKDRTAYPQAIICANDYMAMAVGDELKKRGVRIPEDVCLSGCDDTFEARRYSPSITSIRVDFAQLAIRAVQMIDNICHGMEQPQNEYIYPVNQYHRSCGCEEQIEIDDLSALLRKIAAQDDNMKCIMFMAAEYQDTYEEEEYLRIADNFFGNTRAHRGYLCLCTEEQSDDTDQKRVKYSSRMVLKRIFTDEGKAIVCNEEFDRTDILPPQYFSEEKSSHYIVLGIHHKNRSFGYLVLTFEGDNWVDGYMQPYLTCVAKVIEEAEVHRQLTDMEELRKLYQMDPLTGIYNRRGFERQLHILYDEMEENGGFLSIVNIDMDNLKYINDNFGHAEGDFALCLLADTLRSILVGREICARTGGDEYSVLLVSRDGARHREFAQFFGEALNKAVAAAQKPYPIEASFGICCINDEPELSLMLCLQKADERMYAMKKARKAQKETGTV